jgi:hypothetical protein
MSVNRGVQRQDVAVDVFGITAFVLRSPCRASPRSAASSDDLPQMFHSAINVPRIGSERVRCTKSPSRGWCGYTTVNCGFGAMGPV